MDAYVLEWVNLILRWLHVIAGMLWIGTSFHFMKLDQSWTLSSDESAGDTAIGHSWLVHSGGFYKVSKYRVLPKTKLNNLQ